MDDLDSLLRDARRGMLDREAALQLMNSVKTYSELLRLMEAASEVRDRHVGRVYKFEAFMSPITGCSVNPPCLYCRRAAGVEFRPLSAEELRWGAERIASTGVRRLEIGGGTPRGGAGRAVLAALEVINDAAPGLLVRVNVGPALGPEDLERMREMGVVEVGANLETINRDVFSRVKPGDSLEKRMEFARMVDEAGLGVSTTIMVGIGSSPRDYVEHIFWLKENLRNLARVAVTVLRPIEGTPMESSPAGSLMEALKVGALARLILRDIDLGFGGIMNDHRLLPLRIMAGGNREVHLSVLVTRSRHWLRLLSPSETRVERRGDLLFINYLPLASRIVREMGMVPEARAGAG